MLFVNPFSQEQLTSNLICQIDLNICKSSHWKWDAFMLRKNHIGPLPKILLITSWIPFLLTIESIGQYISSYWSDFSILEQKQKAHISETHTLLNIYTFDLAYFRLYWTQIKLKITHQASLQLLCFTDFFKNIVI